MANCNSFSTCKAPSLNSKWMCPTKIFGSMNSNSKNARINFSLTLPRFFSLMTGLKLRRKGEALAAPAFNRQSAGAKHGDQCKQEQHQRGEFQTLSHFQRGEARQKNVEQRADQRRYLRGRRPTRQQSAHQQDASREMRRDYIVRGGGHGKRKVPAAEHGQNFVAVRHNVHPFDEKTDAKVNAD